MILSLSQTISGLHWDRLNGDNDDEVGARGILYLLIFQQLGQLVRWTWGYNVLLKSKEEYEAEDAVAPPSPSADEPLTLDVETTYRGDEESRIAYQEEDHTYLGDQTPITYQPTTGSFTGSNDSSTASLHGNFDGTNDSHRKIPNEIGDDAHDSFLTTFPAPHEEHSDNLIEQLQAGKDRIDSAIKRVGVRISRAISRKTRKAVRQLPLPIQSVLGKLYNFTAGIGRSMWSVMNPPLWAMLAAVLVASIPMLQTTFFTHGTFVNNSVTHAINQTGQVAVPLILVVLGANLGRGTTPQMEQDKDDAQSNTETKLLYASLLARMVLPFVFMGPILALAAKYVPISILDDPIFVIVCFLLTGAPSALQLAQICQTKNVYMGAMSKLLFQSYVVW